MPTIVLPAALGNWGANQALELLFRLQGQLWLALHTDDPLGPTPNEVAGGAYARQAIRFSLPSGRTVVSTTAQTFSGLPVASVHWLAVWTDIAAGQLIGRLDSTANPLVTTDSGLIKTAAGDVAFAF